MSGIFFDTGPIISLTTTNLLQLLKPLKSHYKGQFFITNGVKRELIEKPLKSKKFKFEAIQVLNAVEKGILRIYNSKALHQQTLKLLDLANSCFSAHDNSVIIIQYAEMNALAAAIENKADAFVVDEKTTRLLIENPRKLVSRLAGKLHTHITVNHQNIKTFQQKTKDISVIRSVELAAIAYELKLLVDYILHIPEPKKTLLESIFWAIKMQGCAVSEKEIKELVKVESS